jgi:hypothetical protein
VSAGTYADFFVALGHIESGDNYSFVSTPGYLGYYQFSEQALQAIGFYQGDASGALDFTGGWTPLAAAFGVHDKASFLASPAAQDMAATLWFQKVDADVESLGLGKYEGQTLNGVPITGSGLLAGAHLVGVWGLKSYLESGGLTDPRDGNGEPVSDYISRFAGYATPFSFDHAGADSLAGGAGADRLFGGAADDTLSGGAGTGYLRGDDGNDSLLGGSGFDDINGNKGDDTIDGGSGGGDWLVGGQGNDLITSHHSDDILYGNIGADTLNGGDGAEILRGGQGDDLLFGGAGDDWLSGDRGHDTLTGGTGADTFHTFSGAGVSVVTDFHAAEGDRVMVDPGNSYTLSQVGADVHVDMVGGGELVLQNVQLSGLPDGWIFGA